MSEDTTQLSAGAKAPGFTLLNQDEQAVSLTDHAADKVILYFYPAAATPGCTTQACDFRDNLSSLKAQGYKVIGISPDKPGKLKKFQEKEGLNFDLLSDEDVSVQQAYGVWGKKSMYGKEYFGTLRSTFVIENGEISHAFYNVKAKGHIAFLREQLGI
jgi:thioredoxin-dependent peroxiredoxin